MLAIRLIEQLDLIIDRIRRFDAGRDSAQELSNRFVNFHDDVLREESEERYLLERGFA